jgi:imidazolonepropionase-like amidohydrolase
MVLFNPGTKSIPPGCDQAALDLLLQRIAQNRTWLVPTLASFQYFAPKQWTTIMSTFRDLTVLIRKNQVQILAGTDQSSYLESKGAIPGKSLHEELALLVDAGFTSGEALRAATSSPADYLGLASAGTVENGKSADLVLLDADPLKDINNMKRIAIVIREGHVYDRAALADLQNTRP